MKLTIELQSNEVEGLRQYLINVGEIARPTKEDIKAELSGIIQAALQSPHSAYSDYIKQQIA
jgi:hypothetical protein